MGLTLGWVNFSTAVNYHSIVFARAYHHKRHHKTKRHHRLKRRHRRYRLVTVRQHRYALAPYHFKRFKILNNHNYTRWTYRYKYAADNGRRHYLHTIGGNQKVKFSSYLFLPNDIKSRHYDWGDVQGLTMTPNNHYLYVLCNRDHKKNDNDYNGWIVRYDMRKLRRMGIAGKRFELLRKISYLYYQHKINHFNRYQRKILSAIKVGPRFETGHGQSLAYNTKNHQLWLIQIGKVSRPKAAMLEIGATSLKPVRKVIFKFSSKIPISDVLTFDEHGNAYSFTRSMNKFIKIYKGRITGNSVHFHLIMQGLSHWPGTVIQSLSYNPRTNRLYLVSDGGIMSIPVNKLGHLKNRDVHDSKISGRREFEGITFDNHGSGYLLVHQIPELMKANRIF